MLYLLIHMKLLISDIYSYPVPESVVVVEHPIYKSSSVKNLSMARPVEETEEFLVGNLNLA